MEIDTGPNWCYNTGMRVQKSTDWDRISVPLLAQMHSAPQSARKDLAKMLGNVTGMVQRLGQEEVELRRNKKATSQRRERLLEEIEKGIDDFEKWLILAHLQLG